MTCWQTIRNFLDKKKPKPMVLKELPKDKLVKWNRIDTSQPRYNPEAD